MKRTLKFFWVLSGAAVILVALDSCVPVLYPSAGRTQTKDRSANPYPTTPGSELVAKDDYLELFLKRPIHPPDDNMNITIRVKERTYDFPLDCSGFVAAFFISDERKVLLSLWSTGSSYRVVIFRFNNDTPVLVDEIGSKQFPDIMRVEAGWMLSMRRIESVVILQLNDEGYIVSKRMETAPDVYLEKVKQFATSGK